MLIRSTRALTAAVSRAAIPALQRFCFASKSFDIIGSQDQAAAVGFSRHKTMLRVAGVAPAKANDSPSTFVQPSSTVAGNVFLSHDVYVGIRCVLRADSGKISVGSHTHIGDGTTINTGVVSGDVKIGSYSKIGRSCSLRSCTIHPGVLLEDGAIVCDGAVLERGCTIQAGAVVPSGTTVPALSIWGGNGVVGQITEDDLTARADANVAAVESEADLYRLEYPDGNLLCESKFYFLCQCLTWIVGISPPETSKPARNTPRRAPGMTPPYPVLISAGCASTADVLRK
jgi:carbonic anhydrase/acetyltransferase-like protein (isoleucine patch superfamily)